MCALHFEVIEERGLVGYFDCGCTVGHSHGYIPRGDVSMTPRDTYKVALLGSKDD